jgi:hypothetical protein
MPRTRSGAVVPEHAFCAAASELDLVEQVAAGDWLVRLKLSTPEALVAYAQAYRGKGAAVARRAASLVRARVDSVQETRLRLCVVLTGLPEPRCNVLLGSDERPIGHVDLLIEEFKLILEYEGDQHRTDSRQWTIDIDRVEEFAAEGYRTIRVTKNHMRQPRALIQRIHAALVEAGYQGPPPNFTREWCALFERFAR